MTTVERIGIAAFQLRNNGQVYLINRCLTGPDAAEVRKGLLERAETDQALSDQLWRLGFIAKWQHDAFVALQSAAG